MQKYVFNNNSISLGYSALKEKKPRKDALLNKVRNLLTNKSNLSYSFLISLSILLRLPTLNNSIL